MKNRCFLTFCSFLKSVTFINFLREIWTIRIQRWKVETLGHKLNHMRAFQSISVLHTWGNLENSIFCGLCLVGGAHHSKVDTFAVPMPCHVARPYTIKTRCCSSRWSCTFWTLAESSNILFKVNSGNRALYCSWSI